jgi:hypothetical protein
LNSKLLGEEGEGGEDEERNSGNGIFGRYEK